MSETSPYFPDAFYRVTVKGLYVKDGKVLLTKESDAISGHYELPGGGLDFGEDIETALAREIKEEMGLTISKMSKVPVYVWTHKYENRRNIDWYYSCVLVYRIEFVNLDFTITPECESLHFFTPEELQTIDFGGQMAELPKLFKLADFKGEF